MLLIAILKFMVVITFHLKCICICFMLFEYYLSSIIFFYRILAPTTYIFFASAIPVISFGEQLERNTGKTCFCSILQLLVSYFSYVANSLVKNSLFCRWNHNSSADTCINCTLWCNTLNHRWTTTTHTWCSWAHSLNVHLYVQFC